MICPITESRDVFTKYACNIDSKTIRVAVVVFVAMAILSVAYQCTRDNEKPLPEEPQQLAGEEGTPASNSGRAKKPLPQEFQQLERVVSPMAEALLIEECKSLFSKVIEEDVVLVVGRLKEHLEQFKGDHALTDIEVFKKYLANNSSVLDQSFGGFSLLHLLCASGPDYDDWVKAVLDMKLEDGVPPMLASLCPAGLYPMDYAIASDNAKLVLIMLPYSENLDPDRFSNMLWRKNLEEKLLEKRALRSLKILILRMIIYLMQKDSSAVLFKDRAIGIKVLAALIGVSSSDSVDRRLKIDVDGSK